MAATRHKYGARPTNGFASAAEAARYQELLLMQKAGVIHDLERGHAFAIQPDGCAVLTYTPDALYGEQGRLIAEDTKSRATLTTAARIRMKLFRWKYPQYELRIVRAVYSRGRIVRWDVEARLG